MAAETYGVNICSAEGTSVSVNSSNASDVFGDGTVSYDASTRTLTLTNAKLKYIQETAYEDLTIVLAGSNSFYVGENDWNFCINAGADLIISGTGSTVLKNDFYNPDDPYGNYGFPCIMAEGDMTIDGAKIEAASKAGTNPIYCIGDMEIKNGADVTSNAVDYPGLWSAAKMTIDSSKVTVTSGGNGIWADGLLNVTGNSNVNVTAGAGYVAIGTSAGTRIDGSAKVTASGYNGLFNNGSGDIEIGGDAQVNITSAYGIWNMSGGKVTISDGLVEVYGSGYAIVAKPDLSQYPDLAIFAGANKDSAVRVGEDSAYNAQHYVRIQHGGVIPATGDGANLAMWIAMLTVSAIGMAAIVRKTRKSY